MPSIIKILFLDGIISEMNLWLKIINVELVGRCANVTVKIPIGSHDSIHVSYKHIMPDIEFTSLV